MPQLPESQLERIKRVFAARQRMRPILVVPGSCRQAEALGPQAFELQRVDADHYQLLRTNWVTPEVPPLHGEFIFVILADDPGRIYCGGKSLPRPFRIAGHTSLSARQDVLFAGELRFNAGRLLSWNNFSGHYLPDSALRYVNLIPAVRLQLPGHLFDACW
ncbi:hypothetical protein KNO81_42090 [Paraburkholderia sediminicola]|jgi:hypothetical protein|nr:hypothetical protein [Paraburkholderia sediminicola]